MTLQCSTAHLQMLSGERDERTLSLSLSLSPPFIGAKGENKYAYLHISTLLILKFTNSLLLHISGYHSNLALGKSSRWQSIVAHAVPARDLIALPKFVKREINNTIKTRS